MKVDEQIIDKIGELITSGDKILMSAKTITNTGYGGTGFVSQRQKSTKTIQTKQIEKITAIQWKTSSSYLLEKVFGNEVHLKTFLETTDKLNYENVRLGIGILVSAKEVYENGYLFDTRTLIEAEIFDDLLEQAEELYKKGYYQASAIIVGCVLEDALRKLCDKNSISLQIKATIEPMNIELAKAGIYNKLWQKKITALADLRNKAAHNLGGFTDKDVEDMIHNVRRFMEDYFS